MLVYFWGFFIDTTDGLWVWHGKKRFVIVYACVYIIVFLAYFHVSNSILLGTPILAGSINVALNLTNIFGRWHTVFSSIQLNAYLDAQYALVAWWRYKNCSEKYYVIL